MSRYQPPFSITPAILNLVVEIGELLGHWSAQTGRQSPLLCKENRIRTIQASLAIEHNSLSTDQVTALVDGKRVLAPVKDIQEVRNAILAYERMPQWQRANLNDLLTAHRTLMAGLVDYPGALRQGDVGIYRDQQLIHMAPPASQVPRLMNDLLAWLDKTELHPLVASSVFHYEFEFIHPFSDGNGRMGRLWQTLILSKWRQELAWVPVETLIHYQQERYYAILGHCDKASDCTAFVMFMLENMALALKEGLERPSAMSEQMSEEMSEQLPPLLKAAESEIVRLLSAQPSLTAKALAEIMKVSARTVERHLQSLQVKGVLMRSGEKKGGSWWVK
ncbi:MAG TPA: Fic family protein [Enterobacteriaceae bacterium]|nr:Fic family protein [Enterobacteriaceae bacterium]